MKLQLTKSKSSRDRYYLISGSMGCAGMPANHANHKYEIVNGIDRGRGYQGYIAVSYFLKDDHIPQHAKTKVINLLKSENLAFD